MAKKIQFHEQTSIAFKINQSAEFLLKSLASIMKYPYCFDVQIQKEHKRDPTQNPNKHKKDKFPSSSPNTNPNIVFLELRNLHEGCSNHRIKKLRIRKQQQLQHQLRLRVVQNLFNFKPRFSINPLQNLNTPWDPSHLC